MTNNNHDEASGNDERREDNPSVDSSRWTGIGLQTQHRADDPGEHQQEPAADRNYRLEVWKFRISVAQLVVVTAGLFVAALGASFAYTQLNTLKAQLDTVKANANAQLRAYVVVTPNELLNVFQSENDMVGYVTVANAGQTLARIKNRWMGIEVLGSELPVTLDGLGRLDPEEGVLLLTSRLSPPMFRARQTLTGPEYNLVHAREGQLRVYIFGRVEYEDIFRVSRFTNFCFMYYGSDTWEGKSPIAYHPTQAKYCDKHNDASDVAPN